MVKKVEFSEFSDIYPFERNFFKIKNYNYHYVDEGTGAPLVMVHGNPTWSFFFRKLIRQFSSKYRVIAPDHIGCGLSDKPSEEDYEYSLETHIDNLESLLIALDLKNITLVLHDWGGAIGMGFACRYPNRIKSLVIFNSSAFSFNWMPLRISMCRIPAFGRFCVRNLNLFSRLALTMAVRKPLSAKVKKGYLYPYQNYEDRVAIERFIDDIPMSPVHKSYEVLLQIEHGLWMFRATPACFIWGMRDWCFNSRFLERWALFYPQAHIYTLNNSGHYLLEDNPQKITFHMKTFFKNYKI